VKSLELVPAEEVEYVKCDDVKPEDMKEILEIFVPQMEGILESHSGLGLAAPQVGIKKKFFIAQDLNKKGKYDLFINPIYTGEGSRIKTTEGCLTYPDKQVEMKRFKSIRLIHYAWDGKNLTKKIDKIKGVESVVYQHETDHLKGKTLFTK
jgi:peptide deformylase